jgi:rhodanese-related sulfurtransferase
MNLFNRLFMKEEKAGAGAPLEIDVARLQAMRGEGEDFLLLDVREPSEHQRARIEGAILIPLGVLPARAHELPKDKRIVVHCHHGGRSMRATQWLRNNGFSLVSNLAGGIDQWSCRIDKNVPRY